jgi:transposase-like protein
LPGVSTRKVTAVMEELCGLEVTSSQVSRAVQALDAERTQWRERPLGEIPYLFLDARYENVRVNGVLVSCAVLVAVGGTPAGRRTVLGLSVSRSEAELLSGRAPPPAAHQQRPGTPHPRTHTPHSCGEPIPQ